MAKKPTYCTECDQLRNASEFCECGNCKFGCCVCLRCGECKSTEANCDCEELCTGCDIMRPSLNFCIDHGVCNICCDRYHTPDDPNNQ